MYSFYWSGLYMIKSDAIFQRVFASMGSGFGLLKKGLVPAAVFLIFSTSCDKLTNKEPSDPEASSANAVEDQLELERIQKEKEEQERKAKELEAAEKQRLEQERLEREQEEARRKAEADSEQLRMRREEARSQAIGQQIARLETVKGDVYENVVIRDVTAIGIEIRHDAGSRRVPFEQLPQEMQQQFLFDPKEKQKALAHEHAAQSAHMAQMTTTDVASPNVQGMNQPGQKEEYRLKVTKAIATKSARIQVLEDEIHSLENDLVREDNKKYNRSYYSNGRWRYGTGGVSRAPIIREQLNEKRQECSTLRQQVGALRVELDSMR